MLKYIFPPSPRRKAREAQSEIRISQLQLNRQRAIVEREIENLQERIVELVGEGKTRAIPRLQNRLNKLHAHLNTITKHDESLLNLNMYNDDMIMEENLKKSHAKSSEVINAIVGKLNVNKTVKRLAKEEENKEKISVVNELITERVDEMGDGATGDYAENEGTEFVNRVMDEHAISLNSTIEYAPAQHSVPAYYPYAVSSASPQQQ